MSLGGRSPIMTLELAKLEGVAQKPIGEMRNRKLWAMFFQYLTDPNMRGIMDLLRNSISFARGPQFCEPEALKTAFSVEVLAKLKFRKNSNKRDTETEGGHCDGSGSVVHNQPGRGGTRPS